MTVTEESARTRPTQRVPHTATIVILYLHSDGRGFTYSLFDLNTLIKPGQHGFGGQLDAAG